jgi:chemotaxis regulatin CheY-phosphate phosphatase CheZ
MHTWCVHQSNVCRGQVEEVVAKQIVNGLADLLYQKPSLMMQYSKQVFDILVQDHHQHMRLHVTKAVITLVLSGVLRFKEGVGKLVFLLVDTDPQVRPSLHPFPFPFTFLVHPPHHLGQTLLRAQEAMLSMC